MRAMRFITAAAVITLLPLSLFAAEKAEQKALFDKNCATCHGADGAGQTPAGKAMKVKDLRGADVQKESTETLIKTVTDGKGKMPAFRSKLNREQIQDVVQYVKSLKK